MAVFYKPNIYPLFWFQSSTAFSLAFKYFTSNPEVHKEQCTVILIQRMQRKRVLHCCRCTYAMQTVCVCVREPGVVCAWVCMRAPSPGEHASAEWFKRWQEWRNAIYKWRCDCLDSASDNSCQLCSVQLAYRQTVWWFKTICTFWERESVRAWWFTHAV